MTDQFDPPRFEMKDPALASKTVSRQIAEVSMDFMYDSEGRLKRVHAKSPKTKYSATLNLTPGIPEGRFDNSHGDVGTSPYYGGSFFWTTGTWSVTAGKSFHAICTTTAVP